MLALSRQKIDELQEVSPTIVLYKSEYRRVAIDVAKHYRQKMTKIEMLRKSSRRELQEYKEFALRNRIAQILYIEDEENASLMDVKQNTTKVIKIRNILE